MYLTAHKTYAILQPHKSSSVLEVGVANMVTEQVSLYTRRPIISFHAEFIFSTCCIETQYIRMSHEKKILAEIGLLRLS